MPSTERLYYRDAEMLNFDARAIGHHQDNTRMVILDRTAFYPTSGGQPHDLGTINGIAVTDVIDAGDVIVHQLAESIPLGAVRGEVDARRRHDHMQQHAAQHLISAIAADRLKWSTTSVHFGADESSIEFDAAGVSPAQLQQLEEWSNQAVEESHAITVTFEDAASAQGLRTPAKRDGELRIITIAGLDRSACGGTHVSGTSAIGAIRLTGVEKVRGNVRVGFLAGERTRQRMRSHQQLIASIAEQMGCAPGELAELVPKRMKELQENRAKLEIAEGELASQRVRAMVEGAGVDADGIRRVSTSGDIGELRKMAQQIGGMNKVILVAHDPATGGLLIATSGDSGLDAGATMKRVVAAHGGKGGGSPRMAQGSVPVTHLAAALADMLP